MLRVPCPVLTLSGALFGLPFGAIINAVGVSTEKEKNNTTSMNDISFLMLSLCCCNLHVICHMMYFSVSLLCAVPSKGPSACQFKVRSHAYC
jgi:hypothetical protein